MATQSNRASVVEGPGRPRSDAGLSIVVPVFNEAEGLARLHERIVEVARRLRTARGLRVRGDLCR